MSVSSPLSWARVLYDFSARDSSELSLRMGDDVKITSKDTPEGWWMGESYGQVISNLKKVDSSLQ